MELHTLRRSVLSIARRQWKDRYSVRSNPGVWTFSLPNPTNAVGGLFILSLQKGAGRSPVSNPTNAVGGTTNAVGGSFILCLQKGAGRSPVSNPTNAVGGSFILCLECSNHLRGLSNSIHAVRESLILDLPERSHRPIRLSMNDPPTALVGFETGLRPAPFCRQSMNDPPTARLCENSVIKLSIGLESGLSPSLKTVAAFDQFVQIWLV